ncbi:hypothetical protein DM02DRAFT_8666 [Periconia macrospinosa]|uniref:Uncharacterized protein n=1 Tax=Periconia macrospinosa TaxID=97972 RepID=A0A2V1EDM8_9PLEO|nr:hypothetical protein DM02DRAFT_8666 [Periconia macrospinosa]
MRVCLLQVTTWCVHTVYYMQSYLTESWMRHFFFWPADISIHHLEHFRFLGGAALRCAQCAVINRAPVCRDDDDSAPSLIGILALLPRTRSSPFCSLQMLKCCFFCPSHALSPLQAPFRIRRNFSAIPHHPPSRIPQPSPQHRPSRIPLPSTSSSHTPIVSARHPFNGTCGAGCARQGR